MVPYRYFHFLHLFGLHRSLPEQTHPVSGSGYVPGNRTAQKSRKIKNIYLPQTGSERIHNMLHAAYSHSQGYSATADSSRAGKMHFPGERNECAGAHRRRNERNLNTARKRDAVIHGERASCVFPNLNMIFPHTQTASTLRRSVRRTGKISLFMLN